MNCPNCGKLTERVISVGTKTGVFKFCPQCPTKAPRMKKRFPTIMVKGSQPKVDITKLKDYRSRMLADVDFRRNSYTVNAFCDGGAKTKQGLPILVSDKLNRRFGQGNYTIVNRGADSVTAVEKGKEPQWLKR